MTARITDYHVHSNNSGDAEDSVLTMCRRAVELGMSEIAFTEHVDFEPTDPTYGGFDHARYMDDIAEARRDFGDRLIIHAGVECDYQERYQSELETFLSDKHFDYVLGGAHYGDGLLLETHHQTYFPNKTERKAYTAYFDTVKSAVGSGLFDAIAHLDLCKRYGCLYYGVFCPSEYEDILSEILGEVIRQGLALEINTSGLRQAVREPYPGREMLNMYARLGGKSVVLGSDAHRASDLGGGLSEAREMAAKADLEVISLPRGVGAYSTKLVSQHSEREGR